LILIQIRHTVVAGNDFLFSIVLSSYKCHIKAGRAIFYAQKQALTIADSLELSCPVV
jgi:hypothetical protein